MLETQAWFPIIQQLPERATLWIAFSGGLDSSVLLHALSRQPHQWGARKVHAVHVDHGLQPQSKDWRAHCQAMCERWGVPFVSHRVDIALNAGESVEAAARLARYAYFKTVFNHEDCLLTAHHQDDQAETLLLQLLRGAGPQGLSAMPMIKAFGQGYLVRPLLQTPREVMMAYAQAHQLVWIDDPSNADTRFDRNFLRQEIFPMLKQRWPSVSQTLARSAQLCAAHEDIVRLHIEACYPTVLGTQANTLSIKKLLTLSDAVRAEILRHWLRQLALPTLNAVQLKQLEHDVLSCRQDADPEFRWPGGVVRRYRDDLYASVSMLDVDVSDFCHVCVLDHTVQLPKNLGIATLQKNQGNGIAYQKLTHDLCLRFYKAGDDLKQKFQALAVPPWQRQYTPLLVHNDKVIAIADRWVHPDWRVTANQIGWEMKLTN